MPAMSFDQAVEAVVKRDPRYAADAYGFLRDALDDTIGALRKDRSREVQHVSGRELCLGFRRYALEQFGPMVPTVLEAWGVRTTRDLGEMVFNLIALDIFNKSDTDSIDDFNDVYGFHEAFEKPFLPVRNVRPLSPPPPKKERQA